MRKVALVTGSSSGMGLLTAVEARKLNQCNDCRF